jgi:deoxyribonuclease V
VDWPGSFDRLIREQERLAAAPPPPWTPPPGSYSIGGCFICFPRGKPGAGAEGDPAWAGAVLISADRGVVIARASGQAGARYEAGLLALREGPLLEAAVRNLPLPPAVLLVNATGRDHPRRAGLAFHLGALLDLPTVGVTHRPLLAEGAWPEPARGARTPLFLAGDRVGHWLCTRDATRPLAVHAAWRTDPETAVAVVLRATSGQARTPEPIRSARRVARLARAASARPG